MKLLGTEDFLISFSILSIAIFALIVFILLKKSYIQKVLGLSGISAIICLLYLLLDAPDVAMTESSIGACLSTVILIIFSSKLPFSNNSQVSIKSLFKGATISIIAVVFGCFYLESLLPAIGDSSAKIHEGASKYYLENTYSETHIQAFVAAILASYRGFDTLGETIVILIAGISVALILGIRDAKK